MRTVVVSVALLIGVCGCDSKASLADERDAVMNVLHTSLDRPNTELSIEPIVIRTQYGVADWVQGDTGGRALLHKEHGKWKVVTNAGEAMRDAEFLEKSGVPQLEAKALRNVLIATERQVPEERLAKFDRFGAAKSQATASLPESERSKLHD